VFLFNALHLGSGVMVRQLSRAREDESNLQEPEAHEVAAAWNGEINDP
jgi:hypothetical protein